MLTKITFRISPVLLHKARKKAMGERKTLDVLFRDWVEKYVGGTRPSSDYREVMGRLRHVASGGKFSREELNKRKAAVKDGS